MPLAQYDPDHARGRRGPGPVLGRGAWQNILEIRQRALALEKALRSILLDSDEKNACLLQLDAAVCYAESIVGRYDRNGPPETQSEIGDLEAVIRVAVKFPENFKSTDIAGLKAVLAAVKKKGAIA
jgi:hypothetical protein